MKQGNYQRKSNRTFYLTRKGQFIIVKLAEHWGSSQAGVVERAVREMYKRDVGNVEKLDEETGLELFSPTEQEQLEKQFQ